MGYGEVRQVPKGGKSNKNNKTQTDFTPPLRPPGVYSFSTTIGPSLRSLTLTLWSWTTLPRVMLEVQVTAPHGDARTAVEMGRRQQSPLHCHPARLSLPNLMKSPCPEQTWMLITAKPARSSAPTIPQTQTSTSEAPSCRCLTWSFVEGGRSCVLLPQPWYEHQVEVNKQRLE